MTDIDVNDPCPTPSLPHRQSAAHRQSQLTKPDGALGMLETVAITLAGLQSTDRPQADCAPVIVFAADHGVVSHGVSAYPPEVTTQMVANFAGGGAAISVLCRELGLPLEVIDVGTTASTHPAGVLIDKPRPGTADMTAGPAMTSTDLEHALGAGRRGVLRACTHDPDLLILGEMGIGNTTAATAVAAALTGMEPHQLVGPGTGLQGGAIAAKAEVIDRALRLHQEAIDAAPDTALETLRRVGGLEIAALTGAVLTAAHLRIPVLVDGFIVSAAALAAVQINPTCRPWLLFSHRSAEPGHQAVLDALDAHELLSLDLRLGEGTGAALALPLLRMACALHNQMATFSAASVSARR